MCWAERPATFPSQGGPISSDACVALGGQDVRSHKRPTDKKRQNNLGVRHYDTTVIAVYHIPWSIKYRGSRAPQHDGVSATDDQAVRRCTDITWRSTASEKLEYFSRMPRCLPCPIPHDSDSRLPYQVSYCMIPGRSEPPRSNIYHNTKLI